MDDGLIIRQVRTSDFSRWKPLWDGYNAFYGRKGEKALPDAITQTTWSRFLNESEPVYALVAENLGHLVGLVHYLFHRSTIYDQPICYLQDLFTAEASRGQGVGRALITEVYRYAAQASCPRVYWHTHETNETAMKLYDQVAQKSGFVVYRKEM